MSEEDYTYKANKNRSLSEDDPTRMSTSKRRQFGWDCNRRSREGAIYSRMDRWLNSKVGSNWNNVWADICSKSPPKDKAQMFSLLREHPEHFVILNCYKKEDGGIYTLGWRGIESRVDKTTYLYKNKDAFYVYENILRKTRVEKNKQPTLPKVVSFEGNDYYKKDGIWYRIILKGFDHILYHLFYDSLHKRKYDFCPSDGYKYYGKPVFCHQHFPLKSKELSALKKHLRANLGHS